MGDGFDPADVAASYDAMALRYAELFGDELARNPSDRDLLDRFVAALPQNGPVCDLGCGPGHVAAALVARGVEAVGVDLSPGMVELGQRLHPEARFEVGDIRSLAESGRTWAGISAFYSLIHLRRDELRPALSGLRAALVPQGVLVAIVHEGGGEIHTGEWNGEAINLSATHFTESELRGALEEAGFTIEAFHRRSPYEWEYQRHKLQVLARR